MLKIAGLFSILFSAPFYVGAASYNYSYWGDAVHSAPGMTYANSITAENLNVTFSSPEDLVIFEDYIYVVDSKANNLVVIDDDYNRVIEKTSFVVSDSLDIEGLDDSITLNSPSGIDVTENGIFICDTANYRILVLDFDYQVIDIISEIDDATFDEISFEPLKITVDSTNRMYVVAKNVYEGIVEINYDGSFNRFTGVNPIQLTPFEIFSRSIMTEEQIAKLQLFLPTEYTNVDINDKNFIYATSKVSENNDENPIQLINPKGVDVIKANGYHPLKGDVIYIDAVNPYVVEGPSSLVDIAIGQDGIYTVLDQKRSRLFTYDSEGNLLYIDGDEGSQTDRFNQGVALGYMGDNLLVLDRDTKTIVVYEYTEFGELVNLAIHYHNNGEFEKAAHVWEEVIKINANYEIAYNGIGKLLLRQGKYKEALQYFELGHDQYYYSKAYQEYRNEILKANFGWIILGVVVIVSSAIGFKVYRVYKKGGTILYED